MRIYYALQSYRLMYSILYGKRPRCSISLLVFRGVAKVSELDTLSLSLSLSGLAPCRLTETPSKHDSNGIDTL